MKTYRLLRAFIAAAGLVLAGAVVAHAAPILVYDAEIDADKCTPACDVPNAGVPPLLRAEGLAERLGSWELGVGS